MIALQATSFIILSTKYCTGNSNISCSNSIDLSNKLSVRSRKQLATGFLWGGGGREKGGGGKLEFFCQNPVPLTLRSIN